MDELRQVAPEKLEMPFAVGYLSAMLLVTELVPALEKAEHARALIVAGLPRLVLKQGRLDPVDLGFVRNHGGCAQRSARST